MLEAFATIGALALVFGAVFSLYFGLRRVIRPEVAAEEERMKTYTYDHRLHGLER